MNLIEKLGIEKCKAIVDGAPEWVSVFCLIHNEYLDFSDAQDGYTLSDCSGCVEIINLRTALANHLVDRTDMVTDIKNHISPLTEVIER